MRIYATLNFLMIQELCKSTKEELKMIAIIGYPGAGKTVGLSYYQKTNKNVIYMIVRKSMSAKEFYIELLNAVGYEGDVLNLSLYDIINVIVSKIRARKRKLLLIIDEAGKFKPRQLEYIHELRDQTSDRLGIILAGPEYFYDNLFLWKEKKVIGIPEVFRRIEKIETLRLPTFKEISDICKDLGVNSDIEIKKYRDVDNFSELANRLKNRPSEEEKDID
ncbi:MAG: ATP-binding protein [Cellulophaga sp.]|uniref:ATP-binding protein n=1 Tax=Cellulophaga sp. TaxID=1972202 RepID=UPI003267E8DF